MLCATFSIICVVKKSVTRVFEAFPKWLQQGACGVSGVELRIRCAGSIRHVAPGKTMVIGGSTGKDFPPEEEESCPGHFINWKLLATEVDGLGYCSKKSLTLNS